AGDGRPAVRPQPDRPRDARQRGVAAHGRRAPGELPPRAPRHAGGPAHRAAERIAAWAVAFSVAHAASVASTAGWSFVKPTSASGVGSASAPSTALARAAAEPASTRRLPRPAGGMRAG